MQRNPYWPPMAPRFLGTEIPAKYSLNEEKVCDIVLFPLIAKTHPAHVQY